MQDTSPDHKPPDASLEPGEKWRTSYGEQTYLKFERLLCHFALKAGNSNAPAGGVRLTSEDALDLPYVSVRTAIACGRDVPLDYTGNANPWSKIASQIEAYEKGEARPPSDQEEQIVREVMDRARLTRHAFGLQRVPVRLTQLLIEAEHAEGGYLAVTPLNSPGLGQLLSTAIQERNTALKDAKRPRIRGANLPWGGANPHNIGARVRAMQSAVVFAPPRSRTSLKRALYHYNNGISLNPPRDMLDQYRGVRAAIDQRSTGDGRSTMRDREAEKRLLRGIVSVLHVRAEQAHGVLTKQRDRLPGGGEPLISKGVASATRALIDPDSRYHGWKRDCALVIARRIVNAPTDKQHGPLALRERSIDSLVDLLEEAL